MRSLSRGITRDDLKISRTKLMRIKMRQNMHSYMEQFNKINRYYGNKIKDGASSVGKRFLRFVKKTYSEDDEEDEEGRDQPSDFDF